METEEAARKLGFEQKPEFLGSGVSAHVWALDEHNVLKRVWSDDDASPYRRVMRLQRVGLCRAFATVRAELQDPDEGWWFVQERVRTARQLRISRTWSEVEPGTHMKPDLDEVTETIARSVREAGWIRLGDLHDHNVGFRSDGSVAVIDLGSGFTPEPSPLPMARFARVRAALARTVFA